MLRSKAFREISKFIYNRMGEYKYSRTATLNLIPDVGTKVRSVAQMDYMTQLLCQPIFSILRDILLRMPQDCTISQSRGVV